MRKSLLILTLVAAACSGGSSEGPHLTFADFNNPPTSTEVPVESTTTTTSVAAARTTSTTSTTLIVVDTTEPVTIRSDTGFLVLEGVGAPRRLLDEPVSAGFDDLRGGFLFQMPGAGVDADADQRIFWARPSEPQAQPYLDVNDGSLLRLWGVESIDGRPSMILTITDNAGDPVARVERLVVFDFDGGDRVLGEVGETDAGPLTITYGGGRFLLEQQAGVQRFFEFRNPQGAVIDLASNPQPGCTTEPDCPATPALDGSGSFLAYLEGEDLVVLDLDLDQELHRIDLHGARGTVTGLDFDGSTVIVNRSNQPALIVDVDAGTFGEFGLDGFLQFLRVGPAFEGPSGL